MHPTHLPEKANRSERQLFTAFEGLQGKDDWVVMTGLTVGQHVAGLSGEVDAVVIAPGKGILLIEAKTAEHVEYRDGQWFLAKNPRPTKNPLVQLDGARRSIRGFLKQRGLLHGDEPIARLVWFTNLGRWQFDNGTPHDLAFFEWELAWSDDLAKPAETVERVLAEHSAWFGEAEGVSVDPASLTAEHATDIADALLASFSAASSAADRRRARLIDERALLEDQELVLDLLETNPHLYFDGPAGCGKSWLVAVAARRAARAGRRTLLTCWNMLMAESLRELVGESPFDIEVADLNAVMLRVCGLTENPAGADDRWYRHELPERALQALAEHPERGGVLPRSASTSFRMSRACPCSWTCCAPSRWAATRRRPASCSRAMPASRSCGRRGSAPSRCRRRASWRRGSYTCGCAATAGWRRVCCAR